MDIASFILDEAHEAIENTFNTGRWAKELGITLASNHIEIVDTVLNPAIKYVTVLASRGSGKSFSICLAAIKSCLENVGYSVIVFGPKMEQANRLVFEITKICQRSSLLKSHIDWDRCSKSRLYFKNTSSVVALSASELSQIEGWHGDLGIVDESHRISDLVFRQRVIPMFTSSANPKLVKIGISMYRNHFYESCHSSQWTHLVYDWTKCPWLFRSGTITIDNVVYPRTIIDQMPLAYKVQRFPNNPELHYDSISGMDTSDFDTQYEMKWVEDIGLLLRADDQEKLFGVHEPLTAGRPGEVYFFGLDFAGGSEIEEGKKRDYTALTIIRKTQDNRKEVVFSEEWQGDVTEQTEQIARIIHPQYGLFKCTFGLADYGNLGAAVVDHFKKSGIPIAGIKFQSTEPTSGKNYKNAMFDQTVFELRNHRFKYPARLQVDQNAILKKHINEWLALESRHQRGINNSIQAPAGLHDDGPCATALALFSADRREEASKATAPVKYKFPNLVFGTPSYMGRNMGPGKSKLQQDSDNEKRGR